MSADRPNLKSETERRMREDWDARAQENAFHYIASAREEWRVEEFFSSGKESAQGAILDDLETICQGREPKQMRVLEIGCGAGRMTRALAGIFGEVHGVDVSGEMIAQARQLLTGCENVHLHQNNGTDLSVLGDIEFDFAFSYIVFQHVPDKAIIESYVHEVYRLLRPGGLFKFQVQGSSHTASERDDTWLGVQIAGYEALAMAESSGFDLIRHEGVEEQYFWLWYLKPAKPEGRPDRIPIGRASRGGALRGEGLARYRLAETLVAGRRVLDVGFGRGEGAARLARSATQVVGLNSSQGRLAPELGQDRSPNLHSIAADCHRLPFSDASFDLVLAFRDSETREEWRALLAEARRVLGVGGRLLVSAPNRRYVQQTEAAPSPEDKHEFTDEEFRAELAKFFPHVTAFLENESDAITFTPREVRGVRTTLESMKPQPEQADGFLAVCSTEPLYGSPAFVYLPWVGNVLYEREGRIDRLRTTLEQTDLMLNATADEIKTLQQEYQQEQQRATEAVEKLEKENEEKTAWANQLQEKLDSRTELEERTQWALKLKAEMDRAMENFRKLEADKDDVVRDLEKSVRLLDDAEQRVIERTGWAQRLDRDLTKAREQLASVYGSPAYRIGRRLGLAPSPAADPPSDEKPPKQEG